MKFYDTLALRDSVPPCCKSGYTLSRTALTGDRRVAFAPGAGSNTECLFELCGKVLRGEKAKRFCDLGDGCVCVAEALLCGLQAATKQKRVGRHACQSLELGVQAAF